MYYWPAPPQRSIGTGNKSVFCWSALPQRSSGTGDKRGLCIHFLGYLCVCVFFVCNILNFKLANYGWISNFKVSTEVSY